MRTPPLIELNVPPAVIRYMQELELVLKQMRGLSPEDALADAREFLLADYEALQRSGETPDESTHYQWIVEHFGSPQQVARQYAVHVDPPSPAERPGIAPGWRICCTQCGRSSPLAALGAIRIGAYSVHKYVFRHCSACGHWRWCRVIQDLNDTNLTQQLCYNQTAAELRANMHVSAVKLIAGIVLCTLASILAINAIVWLIIFMSWRLFAVHPPTSNMLPLSGGRHPSSQPLQPVSFSPLNQSEFTEAVKNLREAVTQQYSYRDLRKIDWNQAIDQAAPKLTASKSKAEFAQGVSALMAQAKDLHIWIEVDGKTVPSFQEKLRLNFNPRVLPRILKSFKQHGTTVVTGQVDDQIDYVLIATWDNSQPESQKAALQAVEQAARNNKRLIIDVRPNAGGDENNAKKIAANFIAQSTHYANARPWKNGVADQAFPKNLEPSEIGLTRKPENNARCLVLMGPTNMSSTDLFLRMMRAAGIKLMGEASRGTSGNPKPHELCPGVKLFLPSWQICDDQGQVIEGQGVAPDILVPSKPTDFQTSDPVLAKAIQALRS